MSFPRNTIREHLFRKKEAIARIRRHPALMIEGQSAGGNDAVDMRMVLQFLSPGMEHAEEADLGAQEFGIAGDLDQRFSAEAQQQRVDEFLVLQCELCQETRHRENDVSIGDGKKFFPSPLDPAQAGVGLAFRAMPITTRVDKSGRNIRNGYTHQHASRERPCGSVRSPLRLSDAGP